MLPEKWKDIKSKIQDQFKVVNSGLESISDDGGTDIEFIEFNSPVGQIRFEYVSRPVVLDKKTFYSNRVGAETKIEYEYDPVEKIRALYVYKLNEGGEWQEIDNNFKF